MPAFDYWDLDEIMAEQYEVTVKPVHDIIGGGVLLPSGQAAEKDLRGGADGTKIQVPFWLAMSFARRNTCTLELPAIYGSSAQEDLQRDPSVCRLCSKTSYYFEVGLRTAYLLKNQALVDDLMEGLQKRWREIVTLLGNMGTSSSSSEPLNPGAAVFPLTLTKVEQELYAGTKEAEAHFKQWMERFATYKIKASSLVDAPTAKRSRLVGNG